MYKKKDLQAGKIRTCLARAKLQRGCSADREGAERERQDNKAARQMTAGSSQEQQTGGSRQEAEAASEAGGSNQETEARKHNENPLGACATRALLTSSSQHRVPTPHLAPAPSPLTPCHACVCGAQMSHVFRQLLPRFAVMEKRCSAA